MNVTCNHCKKRIKCKKLCSTMNDILENSISKNGLYADTTHITKNITLDENGIDNIIYTYGLSDIERRDTRRIIIALLKPDEAEVLKLLSSGLAQEKIAETVGCSQPAISIRIKNIQKKIKDSIVLTMPYIY